MSNLVTVDLISIYEERENSIHVLVDGDGGETVVWLPLSQITINEDQGTITMPQWLAIDRELQ